MPVDSHSPVGNFRLPTCGRMTKILTDPVCVTESVRTPPPVSQTDRRRPRRLADWETAVGLPVKYFCSIFEYLKFWG